MIISEVWLSLLVIRKNTLLVFYNTILTHDPTIKREQALQRTLHKLNKKNIFSETENSDLYPKFC